MGHIYPAIMTKLTYIKPICRNASFSSIFLFKLELNLRGKDLFKPRGGNVFKRSNE